MRYIAQKISPILILTYAKMFKGLLFDQFILIKSNYLSKYLAPATHSLSFLSSLAVHCLVVVWIDKLD